MAEDYKNKNVHSGHRHRMRERFINSGNLDGFQDHEIIEMLLYYVYKRADTNEKAHILLDTYGSFEKLLNAPVEDLMNRGGLSEQGAVLFSMFPHIMRRYINNCYRYGRAIIKVSDSVEYFRSRLLGEPFENFYILFLDAKKRIIKCHLINEGVAGEVTFYPEKIVEQALIYKSSFAIIGHNHPMGSNKPSHSDKIATEVIKNSLEGVCVRLIDHIIISGESEYFSFAENKLI